MPVRIADAVRCVPPDSSGRGVGERGGVEEAAATEEEEEEEEGPVEQPTEGGASQGAPSRRSRRQWALGATRFNRIGAEGKSAATRRTQIARRLTCACGLLAALSLGGAALLAAPPATAGVRDAAAAPPRVRLPQVSPPPPRPPRPSPPSPPQLPPPASPRAPCTPPPPPLPPSPRPSRPEGKSLVAMLNTQFRKGYPANIPERAGVMIHMIDDLIYSLELPWLPCTVESLWCYKYSDRCSASIINEELPYVYDHNFKSIGIVLAPWLVDVMCSFFVDGGTMLPDKTCDTPGISPTCLPGCWKGEANWCDDDQRIFNCAWPPNALSKMLKRHIHRMDGRPWAGFPYNEVILSTTGWKEKLPELIQAFFVLAHRPEEKAVAKHIHKRFRFFYPNSEVPLLELDLWGDLQTPFSYVLV